MINPRDSFMKTFAEGMARALLPAGFRKGKGGAFARSFDEVTQIVQPQRSASSNRCSLRVTVNVGLSAKAVAEELQARGYPPRKEIDCQARSRISSFLDHPREDKWWDVSDDTEAQGASQEIEAVLRRCVLPKLDAQRNGASVLATWQSEAVCPPFPHGGQAHWEFLIEALQKGLRKN